jgi:outer membrane protein TolC
MNIWLRKLSIVCVLCGLAAGCKQQLFLNKDCYDDAHSQLLNVLESNGPAPIQPSAIANAPLPADVTNPERKIFNLTLQEALTLAMENGNTGGSPNTGNQNFDDQIVIGAPFLNQPEKLRVLSMGPAIQNNALEVQLARYDPMFGITTSATVTDELSQSLQSFQNGQSAAFDVGLMKPLPTGGTAGIVWDTTYRYFTQPPVGFGVLNPTYNTRLALHFEQPLWQNYGTYINQLLGRHPNVTGDGLGQVGVANAGALLGATSARLGTVGAGLGSNVGSGIGTGTGGGILLQRLTFDQSRAEFERQVQTLLLNVEVAYWRLYQAYGQLYSNEEVLRIAHRAWMINDAKFKAGTIGPKDYYPVRGQFEEFRGERVKALANVIERERVLRALIGLPVEDGFRIVPVTPPTLAPYVPDWTAAVNEAMVQRPELIMFRDELLKTQYHVDVYKNFMKPQLNFFANYAAVGTGTRLDGNGTFQQAAGGEVFDNNAFRQMADTRFNDFNLGLSFIYPLGFRPESANLRTARLQLAQAYMRLKDQEERVTRSLAFQWQEIAKWYQIIETTRNERKAYADSVEARFKEFAAGKTTIADFLLEAQRRLATAQVKEFEAISEYNNALIRFQWAKGNMLRHNNILVQEGPLPNCALESAVKNERERTRAFVLRNPRPDPIEAPARLVGNTAFLDENAILAGPPVDGKPVNGTGNGNTVIPPDVGGAGTVPLPSTPLPSSTLTPAFRPAPSDMPGVPVSMPDQPSATPASTPAPTPTVNPIGSTAVPDLNFRQTDPNVVNRGMRPSTPPVATPIANPSFTAPEPINNVPVKLPATLPPMPPLVPGMPTP